MMTNCECECVYGLEILNANPVNNWISGKWNGIGFSIKGNWLNVEDSCGCNGGVGLSAIERETRIRTEIRNALLKKFGSRVM